MGRRGPPPKPTPIRVLEGNPSKRPLNADEPKPEVGRPACPEWLDPEAKAEWKRIVPELERLALLTLIDRAALAGYCQAWAEVKWATETLRKKGRTVKTASGYLQQHPAVAIRHKALTLMRQYLTEFGLSPSSRTRLSVPQAPKEVGLDALLA